MPKISTYTFINSLVLSPNAQSMVVSIVDKDFTKNWFLVIRVSDASVLDKRKINSAAILGNR